MMYDPLPPLDSVSGYTPPPRGSGAQSGGGENPLLLFLRSMLPTFENMVGETVVHSDLWPLTLPFHPNS